MSSDWAARVKELLKAFAGAGAKEWREADWAARVKELLKTFAGAGAKEWREADIDTVGQVLTGVSPYSGTRKADGAARVAFNISSAHVPSFVAGCYQNRYDLGESNRIGSNPDSAAPDVRQRIDEILGGILNTSYRRIYYGAVEINGSGVRYYGDVSLLLKLEATSDSTLILDRNSFDLICAPLRDKTHPSGKWDSNAAKAEVKKISGVWGQDLAHMAACKVVREASLQKRRITVGSVSEGVLADEDYMEVIRTERFGSADVGEARLGAADVAVDGLAADRLRRGPTPDWAELLWRHRRRKADQALRTKGVRTRVVVSSGRVRS
jgi:hypothetical protein